MQLFVDKDPIIESGVSLFLNGVFSEISLEIMSVVPTGEVDSKIIKSFFFNKGKIELIALIIFEISGK